MPPMTRSRSHRTGPGFSVRALFCASLLITGLACGDSAAEAPASAPQKPTLERPTDAWRSACLRESPLKSLGRETIPNLDLEIDGRRVQTGALGQRGPEPGDDPRAFRVAALTGSFGFGLGLDQNEAWPRALEAHIDHSMLVTGRKVEILGAGAIDAGSAGLVQLFVERLTSFEPWIVVLELDLEDLAGPKDGGQAVRLRKLFEPDSERLRATEAAFAALREHCAPRVIPMVLMIVPIDCGADWADYPLADLHRDLARAGTRNGFASLDLLEAFAQEPRPSLVGEGLPPHWNARAQALASESLKRFLFETGILSQVLEAH
jgi:hypothetical protein